MAKQHRAVLVQNQRQRQLLHLALYGLVALALGFAQDAPAFQRVGHQCAAALRNIQVVVQHALGITQQGIGQRIGADAARELVSAGTHHQRKAAILQGAIGLGVAAGKGAGDWVAEVGHKHQHQRAFALQQVAEAILRAVRRIIHEKGKLVPNSNALTHGGGLLSHKIRATPKTKSRTAGLPD